MLQRCGKMQLVAAAFREVSGKTNSVLSPTRGKRYCIQAVF